MSQQQHTQEPWRASEEDGNWRAMAADENGGYTLADMCCDDAKANARRIVACVNACAGVPSEVLELVGACGGFGRDVMVKHIEKQRDELLAAVIKAADEIRKYDYTPARSTLLVAISNALPSIQINEATIASVKEQA